jgi:WD40 repeat protein
MFDKSIWKKSFLVLVLLWLITLKVISQNAGLISNLAFAPQTGILALVRADTVELIQLADEHLLATIASPFDDSQTLIDENFRLTEVVFNPSGTELALSYSGYDSPNYILIVDALTGEILHSIIEGDGIYALAWHPDGSQLAAKVRYGSGGMVLGRILVWDIATGNLLSSNDMGFNTTIVGLDWDSSGERLVSAEYNNFGAIWNSSTWTRTDIPLEADSRLVDIAWSSDDSKVIGLDEDESLYVWDSDTGELIQKLLYGPYSGDYDFSISSNDIVAINGPLGIILWNLQAQDPVPQFIAIESPAHNSVWLNELELAYSVADTFKILNLDNLEQATPSP